MVFHPAPRGSVRRQSGDTVRRKLNLLVLRTQQIGYGFDRGEGRDGHFDEDGRPVGHCAVPESGQFECLQTATLFTFFGDKTGFLVNILCEIELFSLEISNGAHQVNRIEVGTASHQLFAHGGIDLRRFGDLKRECAGDSERGLCPEGASAGFTFVAHHAAHAQRTVEHATQIGQRRLRIGREPVAEFLFDELAHVGLESGVGSLFTASVNGFEVGEYLLLQFESDGSQRFLIEDGIAFQMVGNHVVDGFDKDQVGIDTVQVFDQRAVTAGTEQDVAGRAAAFRGESAHMVGQ